MIRLLVVLTIVVGTIAYLLLVSPWEFQVRVATTIATLSLFVSLLSNFKDMIFPFRLSVLAGDVLVAAPTLPSHDSLALVLPISFINEGYAEGVIEGIGLKIVGANGIEKLYTPVAEIDFVKFVQGKRALTAESIAGAFSSFPIHAKQSVQKHILFSQEEHSVRYPFSVWSSGTYRFQLFLKTTAWARPKKVAEFTWEIAEKLLKDWGAGNSVYLGASSKCLENI